MKTERFLQQRWNMVRQTSILIFLILCIIERNTESTWLYYPMLPLLFIGLVISAMQFMAKTRARLYDNFFKRLFDILLLLLFLLLLVVVSYLAYGESCPVCQI